MQKAPSASLRTLATASREPQLRDITEMRDKHLFAGTTRVPTTLSRISARITNDAGRRVAPSAQRARREYTGNRTRAIPWRFACHRTTRSHDARCPSGRRGRHVLPRDAIPPGGGRARVSRATCPASAGAAPKAIDRAARRLRLFRARRRLAPTRGSLPLRGIVTRVVLLGPTHRVPIRGLAAPRRARSPRRSARSPSTARRSHARARCRRSSSANAAHALEHSLEVQLPFLQTVLGRLRGRPVRRRRCVGRGGRRRARCAVGRRRDADRRQFRPVALPPATPTPRGSTARPPTPSSRCRPTLDHEQACGATPINGLLLCARRRGLRPQLLDLRNSGDTAGDRSRVVGYASFAFSRRACACRH